MFPDAVFITPVFHSKSGEIVLSKAGIRVNVDSNNLEELVRLASKWDDKPRRGLMLRRQLCYEEGDYRCDSCTSLMHQLRRELTNRRNKQNIGSFANNRAIATDLIAESTPKHRLAFAYPPFTPTEYNGNHGWPSFTY